MSKYKFHSNAKWPNSLNGEGLESKMAYFDSVKIGHPLAVGVKENIISCLEARYGSDIIMLAGPAGVGKSLICRNINEIVFEKLQKDSADIPCVYIQAGASDDCRFDWKDFFHRVLIQCAPYLINSRNKHQSDSKASHSKVFSDYAKTKRTKRELQLLFEDVVRFRNIKILIIDEAHHIFQILSEKSAYREMEFIKSLSETIGIKIVLSGTYNLLKCTKISAQLSRRMRIINFPRYDIRSEQDSKNFMRVMNELLQHYPVKYDSQFHNKIERFYILSCGCIGILKNLLTNALLECGKKNKTVGFKEVESVALKPQALLRISEEIAAGEHYFSENDISEVKRILGFETSFPEMLKKKNSDKKRES